MSKKQKQEQKNKKSFYITDSNLDTLIEIGKLLVSEPTMTKLVNYAVDLVLVTWLKTYKIEAKTPKQQNDLNLNLSNEVKKYAISEERIR